jgi:hypothetical protein
MKSNDPDLREPAEIKAALRVALAALEEILTICDENHDQYRRRGGGGLNRRTLIYQTARAALEKDRAI